MKAKFFLVFSLLASVTTFAGQIGSNEQKIKYAKEALIQIIDSKGGQYTLESTSLQLMPCEGLINKIGGAIAAIGTGSADCQELTFHVRDKQHLLYSGKMMLDTEHVDRALTQGGLISGGPQTRIPNLDLFPLTLVEEKTSKRFFIGLHALNSQRTESQSLEQLFSLEKIKTVQKPPANTNGSK